MKITSEQFKAAFDLWLQDYRCIAWGDLTTDEQQALCDWHFRNFVKEVKEWK